MHPVYRQTCHLRIVSFDDRHRPGHAIPAGLFLETRNYSAAVAKLPTRLVRCDVTANEHGCGLLQLAHSFPPEILYSNYWYRSATNETMRRHLNHRP